MTETCSKESELIVGKNNGNAANNKRDDNMTNDSAAVNNNDDKVVTSASDKEQCSTDINENQHDASINKLTEDETPLSSQPLSLSEEEQNNLKNKQEANSYSEDDDDQVATPKNVTIDGFDDTRDELTFVFDEANGESSAFKYTVLIDSEDEDTTEKEAEVTHDSMDFMSTEAEKQLEDCDEWSMGSCSFGAFESKSSMDMRRPPVKDEEDPPTPIVEEGAGTSYIFVNGGSNIPTAKSEVGDDKNCKPTETDHVNEEQETPKATTTNTNPLRTIKRRGSQTLTVILPPSIDEEPAEINNCGNRGALDTFIYYLKYSSFTSKNIN